ncbi:carbamoyltransferase HypF [Solemya velum gill symbiont]|uniref:carbamoyltransferase HypF n=1 Tax=Solemya velum gill symbiont TaxID=2340 RepID=UPI001E321A1B|nr:carbamoyltransferase HypF [Solemya velum gill symbiont]
MDPAWSPTRAPVASGGLPAFENQQHKKREKRRLPDNRPAAGPVDISARKITLSGKVQGVGFRPFIYRLATQHRLTGWVRNCVGIVEIHVQGPVSAQNDFLSAVFTEHPPLAKPKLESDTAVACEQTESFEILNSLDAGHPEISLPTDLYLCDDCLAEMQNPSDLRYRYPFINCTQCGPRYTLIEALPYDRPNTTMKTFPLCESCKEEYENPNSRRFHAEPIACPVCGPSLQFCRAGQTIEGNDEAITATVEALKSGAVVAVKGIGGYHLVCDATNDDVIKQLRRNKPRPDKPLAVMLPAETNGLALEQDESDFLNQPSRPILLIDKHKLPALSPQLAPGLGEIGVMLPYSPLHHLLLDSFASPLVATSANISGEPVLTDGIEVERRLAHITDRFLHHNRPIARPADDPVFRISEGMPRPIRLGRGTAPFELALPFTLEHPVLAVGTQMKNVITLAWGKRAVLSPHIGEMNTARALQVFEETIADLQQLYQVKAEVLICDTHPGYTASRWAEKQNLPVHTVLHHHAHAASASYEFYCHEEVIAFTWDGIGLGADETLWGGETFLGKPGSWKRVASFRPFRLPGGDKAAREPWRSAAALCWQSGHPYPQIPEKDPLLRKAWEQGINAPSSSSVGRLFDAAAALSGVCSVASYEGQGAMLLEALANHKATHVPLDISESNDMLVADWQPLLAVMTDSSTEQAQRAATFHASLAHTLLRKAQLIRQRHGVSHVTLSGGVFQNRVLTELAASLLREENFTVHLPVRIPVNDAGISFGQVIEYGCGR